MLTGGLFTATLQLTRSSENVDFQKVSTDAETLAIETSDPTELVRQRQTKGDRQAADQALINECILVLQEAESNNFDFNAASEIAQLGDTKEWEILAEDAAGRWQVRRPKDIPATLIGVRLKNGQPAICCWGTMRQVSEDAWSLSIVRLGNSREGV